MTGWQERLRRVAPVLVDFLGLSPAEWNRVSEKMSSKIEAATLVVQGGGAFTAKTTLYDLVARTSRRDDDGLTAVRFLGFIDRIARELQRVLPRHLHATARDQARNLFLDFSATDSHYLDKVGELATIAYILGATGAKALAFEAKVFQNSSKSLDLVLEVGNGQPVAVEILNVFIDDTRLTDDQGFHAFLDGRVARKIMEKTGRRLRADCLPFPLILVLWFERVENLQRFTPAILSRGRPMELPACTLLQLADSTGAKSWAFGSVATLARRYGFLSGGISGSP